MAGIFGVIGAFIALMFGGLDAAFSDTGESSIIGAGWFAVLLSIVGIVGSVMVKGKPKVGGILMLIAAIGGIISVSWLTFYLVSYWALLD